MSDHRDVGPGPVPGAGFGPFGVALQSSRRRPRRQETATYRVRVEISGTKPPVWRRLDLDSDLFLDEVHEILQAAFGWEDYHLHGFASGPSYYNPESEHYPSRFEVEQGKRGVPEKQVRLDEVLAQKGDRLVYLYDFGDDWEHLLTLKAVLPRDGDGPRALCTAGRRPAPPEGCGGVPGYELLCAATDPEHPQQAEALAEHRYFFGQAPDGAPLPFDIDEVNAALAAVAGTPQDDLPPPVAELLGTVRDPRLRGRLLTLASEATAPGSGEPDTVTVRAAVGSYLWLLDHVGDDGVKLTGAGYLPPASVEEAAGVMDPAGRWIGKSNREIQTYPVLSLRESAQRTGLLRKHKGNLLLTKAGKEVRGDPRALWDHLAARMPLEPKQNGEKLGCLLALLAVAAGSRDVPAEVAALMTGLGWRVGDGEPMDEWAARDAMQEVWVVLDALGGWPNARFGRKPTPTAQGTAFARAALWGPA
ncbi:plasmid pRiA4b ORF-3 family protein [Nocardiopsis oceani]